MSLLLVTVLVLQLKYVVLYVVLSSPSCFSKVILRVSLNLSHLDLSISVASVLETLSLVAISWSMGCLSCTTS